MISRFRTFIAGFLVVLPLAVMIAVIVWVGTFIMPISAAVVRSAAYCSRSV